MNNHQPKNKQSKQKTTTLEPTKKDILHPKTETQRDGRRGAIMVKSNPILATWAIQTEKLLETFSHKSESSEPHIRLPVWRAGLARSPQSIWLWRPTESAHRKSTDEGKQELHSWRMHTRTREKAETSQDPGPDLAADVAASCEGVRGGEDVAPCRDRH